MLGKEACAVVPVFLSMSLLSNSMALSCIALDRYQAVKSGAGNRWEPGLGGSIAIIVAIWIVAAGIAAPMYSVYDHIGPYYIVTVECEILEEPYYFCTVPTKVFKSHYFTIVFSLIFIPLFVTFVGFYSVVAKYIWKQRIPMTIRSHAQTSSNEISSSSNKKGTKLFKKANSKTAPKHACKSNTNSNLGSRSTLLTDSSSGTPVNKRKENQIAVPEASASKMSRSDQQVRTVHTKRKVRTFKVILSLVFCCFITRIPTWVMNVAQADPNVNYHEVVWWLVQFWCSMLSLSSTALNPFLYCFLNETLDFTQIVRGWFGNIFGTCSCTDGNAKTKGDGKENNIEPPPPNRPVAIVPRGPYVHNPDNRLCAHSTSVDVNHI
ncbi:hypothetical protein ANN_15771 [Periplaneta americana]|uniref:G-protein coupled receptors family 1 profile domain-containing protein n=2 Tax=Periplaneta americana TaxID=6978 RepID=A0ABQ8SH51_PERAM|nr:hypothetical protein ANN_15771 [Periplaneta americana]